MYDLCRHLLLLDPPRMVMVLNAEVDDSGVDLILTVGGVTRPVQMKTPSRLKNGNPSNIADALGSLPEEWHEAGRKIAGYLSAVIEKRAEFAKDVLWSLST